MILYVLLAALSSQATLGLLFTLGTILQRHMLTSFSKSLDFTFSAEMERPFHEEKMRHLIMERRDCTVSMGFRGLSLIIRKQIAANLLRLFDSFVLQYFLDVHSFKII